MYCCVTTYNQELDVQVDSNLATLPIIIKRFTDLNATTQEVALEAIANINKATTTDGVTSWDKYTQLIWGRPKNHLFIAQIGEEIAGYVAFYKKGTTDYISLFLSDDNQGDNIFYSVHKPNLLTEVSSK